MSLSSPSPMERHILDLLDRIERQQAARIAALEAQVAALQASTEGLQAQMSTLQRGVSALSASLASFLDPPGGPPS